MRVTFLPRTKGRSIETVFGEESSLKSKELLIIVTVTRGAGGSRLYDFETSTVV